MFGRAVSLSAALRSRHALSMAPRCMSIHVSELERESTPEAEQRSFHRGETPDSEDQYVQHPDVGALSMSERRIMIDRMLRVDHAGETAAVLIYKGQSAVLGNTAEGPCLAEMAEHERIHLEKFQELLPKYRARPSLLLPVWSAAAYALGAGSAFLGKEAAYAVTEAVEEVISEHYNAQIRELLDSGMDDEEELRETFRKFRDDELDHLDTAVAKDSRLAPMYTPLTQTVKMGCRAAIWMAEKV